MASANVENTLKRAHELIDVGQKAQALGLLFDLITNRRQHKKMWTKVHEDAMMLFVRLCVELRDNRIARDGLHSYRSMTQSQAQAQGSLEAVISYMLELSDERVVNALSQCKSHRDVARIDDLEEGGTESPEALLRATAASEQDRVRSEQSILIPWLKFSWENLRSVLDILKNNPELEQTYHITAHRAFAFCKAYGRKLEFRRLCDLLRNHLTQTRYTVKDRDEPSKLSAETMELHLGTRFEQLKVATALHLWLEGFKTIEDIHSIISLSVRRPSAQLMATYYQKLTQMFLVSGSFLFHAFAFRSYYDLSRERNKSLTKQQIESMASSVLLAAMAIPLPPIANLAASGPSSNQMDPNIQKEKNRRMAQLLGFDQINPEREALLKALQAGRVLDDCSPDARELYFALELQTDFDPQNLVKRCAPRIASIRADPKLEPYASPLENLLIVRLIGQLGRVFQSIRLSDFHRMVDELKGSVSRLDAEKLIMKAVRSRQIPLRHGSNEIKIDHASETIRFGENPLEEQRTRSSLSDLAKRLSEVCDGISNKTSTSQKIAPTPSKEELLAQIAEDQAKIAKKRETIALRKQEIEDLHDYRMRAKAEREENARRLRQERDLARASKAAEEARRREEERIVRLEEEERAAAKLRLAGIELGPTADDLSLQDREKLIKEKQEKALQVAVEQEKKVQSRMKRQDAWVRAIREAEKPHLLEDRERNKVLDKEEFFAERERQGELAKERHQEGLKLKAQFARIQPLRAGFETIMKPVWEKNVDEAAQRWTQERDDRKYEAKLERARVRQDEDLKRKRQEEQAQRFNESEARRIKEAEEEKQRKEERLAAERAQRDEATPPAKADTVERWQPNRSHMEDAPPPSDTRRRPNRFNTDEARPPSERWQPNRASMEEAAPPSDKWRPRRDMPDDLPPGHRGDRGPPRLSRDGPPRLSRDGPPQIGRRGDSNDGGDRRREG